MRSSCPPPVPLVTLELRGNGDACCVDIADSDVAERVRLALAGDFPTVERGA
jgi:hypothetical protein